MPLKDKLINHIKLSQMIEDLTVFYCSSLQLSESKAEKVLERIKNNQYEDLFYNTFLSYFEEEQNIEQYLELETKAKDASDNFNIRLAKDLDDTISQVRGDNP